MKDFLRENVGIVGVIGCAALLGTLIYQLGERNKTIDKLSVDLSEVKQELRDLNESVDEVQNDNVKSKIIIARAH